MGELEIIISGAILESEVQHRSEFLIILIKYKNPYCVSARVVCCIFTGHYVGKGQVGGLASHFGDKFSFAHVSIFIEPHVMDS